MSELEAVLHEKTTEELQRAIRYNTLVEDAVRIAKGILSERGAPIPSPQTEEEIEAEWRVKRQRSTKVFLSFLVAVAAWYAYASFRGLFDHAPNHELEQSVFVTGLAWLSSAGYLYRK